jgi:hypothetical protein
MHSPIEMLLADTICGVVSPCGTSPARRTADSSTPDLFRSRNSSLPRGSLSLSRSLIAAGLVDRLSLIPHPSLAGGSEGPGAGRRARSAGRRLPRRGPGTVRGGLRRVASTEPARISANEITMTGVSGSPRTAAPSATATAGLM